MSVLRTNGPLVYLVMLVGLGNVQFDFVCKLNTQSSSNMMYFHVSCVLLLSYELVSCCKNIDKYFSKIQENEQIDEK